MAILNPRVYFIMVTVAIVYSNYEATFLWKWENSMVKRKGHGCVIDMTCHNIK